jgi:hypothetical protein
MSLRHRSTIRTSSLILAAACLLAVPGFARADQVVYFTNGKAITVKTVEKGPKLTVLEIEGGGRIGIPTVQIDRIEDLNLSPPAPVAPPPTPVTAIIPQQPTAAPVQTVPQPQATIPAGPGTGGHIALNSAQKMAPPLAVGGELGDGDPHHAVPQAQATQSTPPGGMSRQASRGPGMMGGPGAMQRGRRGYNPYNHGLPSGAQMNQGAPPQGAPNATPPGQPVTPGQPNAASQAGSGQPATGSQAAQSGQQTQSQTPPAAAAPPPQTPPPAAATPPPPPPPDPEPNDAESGNSDSTDDGSSSSDNESPSGGDSGN